MYAFVGWFSCVSSIDLHLREENRWWWCSDCVPFSSDTSQFSLREIQPLLSLFTKPTDLLIQQPCRPGVKNIVLIHIFAAYVIMMVMSSVFPHGGMSSFSIIYGDYLLLNDHMSRNWYCWYEQSWCKNPFQASCIIELFSNSKICLSHNSGFTELIYHSMIFVV